MAETTARKMRSQEEIVTRIAEIGPDDMLGFQTEALAELLEFEYAKPLLKEGATADDWGAVIRTRDQLLERMREYLSFAWGKALDGRGISASRSIDKFTGWIWALGDDDVLGRFLDAPYAHYGTPKLRVVSQAYGWPEGDAS